MALFGFFFAFFPVLPHLLSEPRVFLHVKIFLPKEVTLGCAPAPELNFWVALIQLSGENHSKTLSYGSLYDHYLSFKHLHLQLLVCGDKIHHHGFNLPESLSQQLLSGRVRGRSGPRWPENTSCGWPGAEAVKHQASGEVRKFRTTSWSSRSTFLPFFTDVMCLQMFPERGSRDQSHMMNRESRPKQGKMKKKNKNYLQCFFSLACRGSTMCPLK